MRSRRQLMWATAACVSLVLAGCGGDEGGAPSGPSGAASADYVAAVEDVVAPAAALAGLAADRLAGRPNGSGPAGGLVSAAEGGLEELREMELRESQLASQRARLVRAFGPMLARMRVVARDLAANDVPGLRRSGPRLFEVIKELPSAISA